MSPLIDQFRKSQGLLGAIDAIADRRAFITLLGSFALAALTMGIFSVGAAGLGGQGHFDMAKVVGGLGLLLTWAVLMIGSSATGLLLNDRVRGREQRSIAQALVLAVATIHRVFGVLLVLAAVVIAIVLLVCVALLVCKIPMLGPLLFAVVYPASAVLLGLLFCAGFFVVALHGPAIWEGHAVFRSVSLLGAIFRERLFSVVVQMLLLSALVCLVATLVMGCLSVGLSMSSGMSMAVLGQNLSEVTSMAGLSSLMLGGGSGGTSYLGAGLFGVTVLAGMAVTAPLLVAIAGNCIVFANVTENLSTTAMDNKLRGAMDIARARAEQARRQINEARDQLSAADKAPVAASATAVTACPQCSGPVHPGDLFCGSCGKRVG